MEWSFTSLSWELPPPITYSSKRDIQAWEISTLELLNRLMLRSLDSRRNQFWRKWVDVQERHAEHSSKSSWAYSWMMREWRVAKWWRITSFRGITWRTRRKMWNTCFPISIESKRIEKHSPIFFVSPVNSKRRHNTSSMASIKMSQSQRKNNSFLNRIRQMRSSSL